MAKGTVRFALGYTEPDGGSDIANAKTRAFRDGDEWVIDGQKMFTSLSQFATHIFLITRTRPDAAQAQGHDHVPGADQLARVLATAHPHHR